MPLPDSCPLCGARKNMQNVVTPHVYGDSDKNRAFYHCIACDVRYQYPPLTQEQKERFYAAEFEGFMAGRSGVSGGWQAAEDHIRANEATRTRRMRYITPHLFSAARILEVGCSSGFMLLPLAEAGHDCVGIEPSGVFREYLTNRGMNVIETLEQLVWSSSDNKFDLIFHFFVLEHIADPKEFIEMQLTLLKPDGKIIFEIPNAADPLYTVYDIPAFERFYWSIAHLWYFSESSLRFLLKNIGKPFDILRDQRYDLSNHMIWARDGRPGGMSRFTKILGRDIEETYKQSLIKSGRCDTLVGIVKNNSREPHE